MAEAAKQGLIEGDSQTVAELLGLLDRFTPDFPLVLPGKE